MPSHDCSPHPSSRALGRLGEELAVAHMARRGFSILARNARTRHGEIDLIAFDGRVLAFVEIKTRRRRGGGLNPDLRPLAGLRAPQRSHLRQLAVAWLVQAGANRPTAQVIRFDAIGVTVDARDRLLDLEHVEAAW